MFTDLHAEDPEMANEIRGTKADPFYFDERIPAFEEAVAEIRAERKFWNEGS